MSTPVNDASALAGDDLPHTPPVGGAFPGGIAGMSPMVLGQSASPMGPPPPPTTPATTAKRSRPAVPATSVLQSPASVPLAPSVATATVAARADTSPAVSEDEPAVATPAARRQMDGLGDDDNEETWRAKLEADIRAEYETRIGRRDSMIKDLKARLKEQSRAAKELGAIFNERQERLRSAVRDSPTFLDNASTGSANSGGGSSGGNADLGAGLRAADRVSPSFSLRRDGRSPLASRLDQIPEYTSDQEDSTRARLVRRPADSSPPTVGSSRSLDGGLARHRSDTAASVRSQPETNHGDSSPRGVPGAAAAIAAASSRPKALPAASANRARRGTAGAGGGAGAPWSGAATPSSQDGSGTGTVSDDASTTHLRHRRSGITDSMPVLEPAEEAPYHAVWGWGNLPGSEDITLKPRALLAPAAPLMQAAIGAESALFLSTLGDVYQWNFSEQDDGVSDDSNEPASASGMRAPRWVQALGLDKAMRDTRIVSVACGGAHCLALTDVGGVYSWGVGDDGRLGHGTEKHYSAPRLIVKLMDAKVKSISAGGAHSAAVGVDGVMYTWGRGRNGRLGLGDCGNQYRPRTLKALKNHKIATAECGRSFTVAVTEDGVVWCWGRGREGQCGPGAFKLASLDVMVPRLLQLPPVVADVVITEVSCGHSHTVALTADGECVSWGYNQFGQLGYGDFNTNGPARTPVRGIMHRDDKITRVSAGAFHTMAQTLHGALLCWGRNVSAELGLGDAHAKHVPHRARLPVAARGKGLIAAGQGLTLLLHGAGGTQGSPSGVGTPDEDASPASANGHGGSARRKSAAPVAVGADAKTLQRQLMDRHRKWKPILENWEGQRHAPSTASLWRLGVPPRLRRDVWPRAIGNALKINPTLFQIYRKRAAARSEGDSSDAIIGREGSIVLIDTDLPRTFPELQMFGEEGPLYQRLREILEVYTCYRPDVGYIQGMSYFAAILCLHIDDPCLAFQCLANLMVKEHLFVFYRLSHVAKYYEVFDMLLTDANPKLYRLFRQHDVRHDQFLFNWFQTMFLKVLPLDTACRVWDWFFLDGAILLYRVAVALLNNLSSVLLKEDDMEVTYAVLSKSPAYRELWESATHPVALFKAVEAVTVPGFVTKKLNRLLHDPFFYRSDAESAAAAGRGDSGAGAGGSSRRGHSRRTNGRRASAAAAVGGSRSRRGGGAAGGGGARRGTVTPAAQATARKLKEVIDF